MTDTDPYVDELEAQLNKQQQMIEALREKVVELSQILPEHDRRQFLKAGGAAGALVGSGLLGRASAQQSDGDTTWGSDSDRDDVYRDLVDANLVSTEEQTVTNETYVEARLTGAGSQSGVSANTYLNLVDLVETDNRGEMNGSVQFTPDRTGTYKISGTAGYDSLTDGDVIQVRVYDVDNGQVVEPFLLNREISEANLSLVPFGLPYRLDAGTTYEVQQTDTTSTWDQEGGGSAFAKLVIQRETFDP